MLTQAVLNNWIAERKLEAVKRAIKDRKDNVEVLRNQIKIYNVYFDYMYGNDDKGDEYIVYVSDKDYVYSWCLNEYGKVLGSIVKHNHYSITTRESIKILPQYKSFFEDFANEQFIITKMQGST